MLRYALRRLVQLVPVLVGVSLMTFAILHAIPGDPIAVLAPQDATEQDIDALRTEFGLNQPLPVQYLVYVGHVLQGNLGRSIRTRDPVAETLWRRLQFTLQLTLLSVLVGVLLGVLAGVVAATHQNTWIDNAIMVTALTLLSIPGFWLSLMLLLVFAGVLHWLPSGGVGGPQHLVLPVFVISHGAAAVIARFTRASMLEVIRQDYIRTVRANGIPERFVVYKHALRNALNPVITIVGLQFGFLLGGSAIVETIFALPGIGRLMVSAINTRDYPVIQGGILLIAVTFVLVNLLTDLVYALVNPRIRYS
ncbi:MAG TPA: ABC transporter permease [Candidatus Limnocylindria bacterium]|nr:ABC transporter permease [Candidatus Limnocylindria bacterium]